MHPGLQLDHKAQLFSNFARMELTTESASLFDKLEQMPLSELLIGINKEDQKVAQAVERALPQIEKLAEAIYQSLKNGGRLFYIGSGTSGRLGIVDASECPPTYGVPFDKVIGIIAGGDAAIRKAQEFAEDDTAQAIKDLDAWRLIENDIVIGISASGKTPYVLGGLQACKERGIVTGCVVCNIHSTIAASSDFPVEVVVGPEFITGSTRMKAGTAQKLVLNMLTTSVMIRLGYVKGNKMVNMQLTNNKLIDRGMRMLMQDIGVSESDAMALLKKHGNVQQVLTALGK